MEPISCTVILEHLFGVLLPQEAKPVIRGFEAGLASGAKWSGDRIRSLCGSVPCSQEIMERYTKKSFRINEDTMRKIARRGLTALWLAGEISTADVCAFADDPASLMGFADILIEAQSQNQLDPIWAHAFDLPPGFSDIHVDIRSILREERERRAREGS